MGPTGHRGSAQSPRYVESSDGWYRGSDGSAFRFLDDLTRSDIGFEATAPVIESLCIAAWHAVLQVQIENPEALRHTTTTTVTVEHADLDLAVHALLEEQLYLRDAENVLFVPVAVTVAGRDGRWRIDATLSGEAPASGRHRFGCDVKAVTMYRYSVKRTGEKWTAVVVLDV